MISRLIHKKHRLFKLAKRLNSDHAWLKYSKARNKLTSALRAAKAQYLENLSTAIHSPRDCWVSYHKLSLKRQCIATDLKYNSHTASTSIHKAKSSQPIFQVLLYLFNSASVCKYRSTSGKQIWS